MHYSGWDRAFQLFVALVAILVTVLTIISIVVTSDQNSLQRYAIKATGDQRVNTTSPAELTGALSLKSNEKEIEWDMQYIDLSGPPTELQIRGPRLPGSRTGPLALALCGLPSSLACDTSVASVLKGTIDQTGAGAQPLRPIIQTIRSEPWRYYFQVNTAAYPDGEIAGDLSSISGTP